jgi:phage protein D
MTQPRQVSAFPSHPASCPYYVPDYRLLINDEPIPAALRASITSVSCQSGLKGADRFEMGLVNDNLRWLDHPLLALNNKLVLSIGYAPEPLEQVFLGEIVGQDATFPSSGSPTLTVNAQDRLWQLQQGDKVRWFAIPIPTRGNHPIADPAVASLVSVQDGLIPIIDPVGAVLAVLLGGIDVIAAVTDPDEAQRIIRHQVGESDYDFLQRIADQNGREMYIDHTGDLGGHQLRFQSALDHLSPDVTLKYGKSLIDFTPRISNVGQVVSVTGYVWLPAIKQRLMVTVGWDWDHMSLDIQIRPEAASDAGKGATVNLIDEPVTLVSAPRRIVSELLPRPNERLTGSGSTLGDPRIRPGTVLQLEGLGEQFGGLYRVTSAPTVSTAAATGPASRCAKRSGSAPSRRSTRVRFRSPDPLPLLGNGGTGKCQTVSSEPLPKPGQRKIGVSTARRSVR